jgi:elongation factor G
LFSGAVTNSLCSRRGRITHMETRDERGTQRISAMAPLAEMFGYASELRGATQGRAIFDMRFEHYEPVPESLAEEIVQRRRDEKKNR